ncbi:MAG TPA: AAA family ATPase [Flavisolibacter sp.]|nr:AAA family ATPase [Flavisolibacter sp.]
MAAKKTKTEEQVDLNVKQRLIKLIVKNFRCIGPKPVEIDLNDIVVLVGENNVGKSSILKAYELVMSDGSKLSELKIDDFPNSEIDKGNLPQIELHIIVNDVRVGDKWLSKISDTDWMVKERWTWEDIGKPKRQGWNVELNDWDPSSYPFGPANIANLRRPEPHKVGAFDKPEDQAEEIKKLLIGTIHERVKHLQNEDQEGEPNDYYQLVEKVKVLQKKIVEETQEQIDAVNAELSGLIEQVFPNYTIDFDARPEEDIQKSINLFKAGSELLMGPQDGYKSSIEKQGSGARRTLLWTALKFIAENNRKLKDDGSTLRPHLLLLDEPEICLHPSAIREACNVLYSLPGSGNWQVMVTTHSPIFIDFSRDNTTIVRVERDNSGHIQGTTVFRPDKAQLSNDDKVNLKFLNLCDPYVSEFLFGGRVIIVEGDTEFTAFNYIKSKKIEHYKNVHIIRARGKATIVSLIKILNHFGSDYSVLHDSDRPLLKTKTGKTRKNSAWGNNPNILQAVTTRPSGTSCRLLASLPNFEEAYFGEEAEGDKPYNALQTIMNDPKKFDTIECLLNALIDHKAALPDNCIEWSSIEALEAKVDEILSKAKG